MADEPVVDPATPPAGDTPPPAAEPPAGDPPAGDEPPKGGDEPPASFVKSLPENWRDQLASEIDPENADDFKKTLERYGGLPDVVKALSEAQKKIRAGEVSTGLPENPTDEQLAAYREANGVPEAPDGYKLTLDDGLVLGEEDDRVMKSVFEVAHGDNIPAGTMNKIVNATLKAREQETARMQQEDNIQRTKTIEVLKDQWGPDYQANTNMVNAFLSQLPADIKEQVANTRLPDGRAMFNVPEIMDFFAQSQRKINPAATVLPGDGDGGLKSIETEIKELEGRMNDDDWHKDTQAQQRYQELVRAREQINAQSK